MRDPTSLVPLVGTVFTPERLAGGVEPTRKKSVCVCVFILARTDSFCKLGGPFQDRLESLRHSMACAGPFVAIRGHFGG